SRQHRPLGRVSGALIATVPHRPAIRAKPRISSSSPAVVSRSSRPPRRIATPVSRCGTPARSIPTQTPGALGLLLVRPNTLEPPLHPSVILNESPVYRKCAAIGYRLAFRERQEGVAGFSTSAGSERTSESAYQNPASRESASPNRSSFTPIRSMTPRYRLQS